MTRARHRLMATAACVGLALTPVMGSSQDAAIEQFKERVNAYMEFRSDFVEMVPPLHVSDDPAVSEAASDGLAGALRAARPQARQGDIFAPGIDAAFRTRIHDALWRHRYPPDELLREIESEAPRRPAGLAVNDRFDWSYGALMPGFLIAALPPLPVELQYRFVGADLVLVDVDARLVVDILPLALDID